VLLIQSHEVSKMTGCRRVGTENDRLCACASDKAMSQHVEGTRYMHRCWPLLSIDTRQEAMPKLQVPCFGRT
jgi:hypothetical protein